MHTFNLILIVSYIKFIFFCILFRSQQYVLTLVLTEINSELLTNSLFNCFKIPSTLFWWTWNRRILWFILSKAFWRVITIIPMRSSFQNTVIFCHWEKSCKSFERDCPNNLININIKPYFSLKIISLIKYNPFNYFWTYRWKRNIM